MATAVVLGQAGLFAGLGLLWVALVIIGILTTIFWVWMLIDCLTSAMQPMEKLIWALVIIFLHFLGALIYYFVGRQAHGGGGIRGGASVA